MKGIESKDNIDSCSAPLNSDNSSSEYSSPFWCGILNVNTLFHVFLLLIMVLLPEIICMYSSRQRDIMVIKIIEWNQVFIPLELWKQFYVAIYIHWYTYIFRAASQAEEHVVTCEVTIATSREVAVHDIEMKSHLKQGNYSHLASDKVFSHFIHRAE